MRNFKKVKGFTLSEMLVVLVISSIVISIAFLSLSMVQKQVQSIRNNLNVKQELQFLERSLWRDFNLFEVTYLNREDILSFKTSKGEIIYEFYDDYILKDQDTFLIKINDKRMYLDGVEVKEGAIDAIQLETSPIFGNTNVFIFKNKDASFYINNE